MKSLTFLFLLLLSSPTLPAQPNGIEQSSDLIVVPAGDKFLRWHGHEDRSYFLQISDTSNPLAKWFWAPIIEAGNDEEISYEVDGTADKGFFRLKYTDQPIPPGETLETADFDDDGISNIDEIDPPGPFGQTDPLAGDTDGDGLPDGWEIIHGLDPNDDGSINPDNGANGDPDNDGSSNGKEFRDGSDAENADDFKPEWIWVTNRVDAFTAYTSSMPHEGQVNYQTWNGFAIPTKYLSEELEPSTVHDELLIGPFPETATEALADIFGNASRIGLESGSYAAARAYYYMTPEDENYGFSDATYTSTRSWLHVPPQPFAREFSFLKITYHSRSGYITPYIHELVDAEGVTLQVLPGQSYSNSIDLETSTSAEDGVTHATWVELQQISILPDANMAGVVGDVVKSTLPGSIVRHFVTPRITTDISQPHVELKAEGISPSEFSQFLEWGEAGEAGSSDEKRKVSRNSTGRTELIIKAKSGGAVLARMIVWVVWAEVTPTAGVDSFSQYPNNAGVKYEIVDEPGQRWRFVFKIEPQALFDIMIPERPDLTGEKVHDAPGASKLHTLRILEPGDDATRKWDASRQMRVRIRNPNGTNMQGEFPPAWYANPPQAETVPLEFPAWDFIGNDDPPLADEETNPYAPHAGGDLDHATGEISSYDLPTLSMPTSRGTPGAFFAKELDFREFARVELWDGKRDNGQFWFRISEHKTWHHHLRTTFNGTTSLWENSDSSSGEGY